MRDFEQDREHLSHDRFRNGFLASIAFTGSEYRGRKLHEALDGRPERIEQIRRAFIEWEALRAEIQAFLEATERRYGLVPSDLFRAERRDAIVALDVISTFGDRFLTAQADRNQLAPLWKAVDAVANFLTRLDVDRARFFTDFDPTLREDANGA